MAFEDIGGSQAFAEWAAANRTEYYSIASKLLPREMTRDEGKRVTVVVNRGGTMRNQQQPIAEQPSDTLELPSSDTLGEGIE